MIVMDTITVDDQPNYRAQIVVDEYPDWPDWDGLSPILRIERRNDGVHVDDTRKGPDGYDYRVPDSIIEAARKFANKPDTFERYLRAFHGTSEIQWIDCQGAVTFVTFDPKAWREKLGAPEHSLDTATWRAAIEGEVYSILVERKCKCCGSWESLDSMSGFYGDEGLTEEAQAMIRNQIEEDQEDN